MTRIERVMAQIQATGGRVTVPTVLVASVLADGTRHLTADDVIDELGRRDAGVADSTVYRVLQRLADVGVLEHVHSGAGATFYHLLEPPHTHLVCSSCGGVTDLDPDLAPEAEAALRALRAVVYASHRFELEPHHGALLGRCAACATSSQQRHPVGHAPVGDESFTARRTSRSGGADPARRTPADHQQEQHDQQARPQEVIT